MCSCYVASRNSDEDQSTRIRSTNIDHQTKIASTGELISGLVKNGFESNGPNSPAALKSNLKRRASMINNNHNHNPNAGVRKVSWSDAHGKNIAHVQEFEPRYVRFYYSS